MRRVQVTPLIGLPQLLGWSQVVVNPEHTLVISLAVVGPNAGNIGRDTIETLLSASFSSSAELHSFLLDLIQNLREQGCSPQFSVRLSLPEKTIYATFSGWVLLKRQSKTGLILSSEAQINLIEGRPHAEDQVVLGTQQGRELYGEIEQKLNQGYEIDTIITSLVGGIHSQADSSLTALAFINPILGSDVPEETVAASVQPESSSDGAVATTKSAGEQTPSPQPASATSIPIENRQPLLSLEDLSDSESPETVAPILEVEDLQAANEVSTQSILTTAQTAPAVSSLSSQENSDSSNEVLERDFVPARSEAETAWQAKAQENLKSGMKETSSRVKNAALGLGTSVKEFTIRRYNQFTAKEFYVTSASPKRTMRVVMGVVVVVIAIAGGLLFMRARGERLATAMTARLQPLKMQVAAAQARAAREPVAARTDLEGLLQEYDRIKNEPNHSRSELKVINQEIVAAQQVFEEISGKEEFSTLNTFFDLRTTQNNFITSMSDAKGETAWFIDNGQKQVITFNTAAKTAEVKTVSDLPTVQSLALEDSQNSIVLGAGIRRLAAATAQLTEIKPEGDSNRDGKLVDTYSQYIYIFNPAKRNIYRYSGSDTTYSDPIGWLKSATGLVFEDVVSWQIDGDVWLGTKKGEIFKYTSGRPETFNVTGLSQPFNSPVALFTNEDTQNLYVLEAAQQRVVILSKTGEFIREVRSSSLASATHILAFEAQRKVLVVSGSVLFEISL